MSILKKKKKADAAAVSDTVKAKLYDVLVRPVITEKATRGAEQNKVVFMISPTADKTQVKQAVETLFGVKVSKVNTVNIAGKTKKFRGQDGRRDDVRKAIVTLAAGQTIDMAAGLR
jgi:large subunit ribosomal protein L23